jgi:c-di-GMP-binding flagellar brake protein YcgR
LRPDESAMPENESPPQPAAIVEERRDDPRIAIDEEAALLLVNSGSRLAARVVEMSLSGCRLRLRDRYAGGNRVRAEAALRLSGIAFRFSGVVEWTDGKLDLGIRFVDVPARRTEELLQVLGELAADQAANAVKKAAERKSAEEEAKKQSPAEMVAPATPQLKPATNSPAAPPLKPAAPSNPLLRSVADYRPPAAVKPPELPERKPAPPPSAASPALPSPAGALSVPVQAPAPQSTAKPSAGERRTQSRHEVDTTATLILVNVGSRLSGRIINLGMGGCRIHTDERFPVGIYTRIETEFRLEGLPFRLGGVVQAIQDRQFVGIRFLDMSERKREQLEQLIEEIEELRAAQAATMGAPS